MELLNKMEFIKGLLAYLIYPIPFVIAVGLLYFALKQYPRQTKAFLLTATVCFILGGISLGYMEAHSN